MAAVAAGCTGAGAEPDPPPPSSQHDIVVVLIDTLRGDRVGATRGDVPLTPAIDRIAARGLRFDRAYAHSAWTLPSTASLLLGRLPHEHGMTRFFGPERYGSRPPDMPTLADHLGGAGYATGAFVNNPFLAPKFGLDHGFGTYDSAEASNTAHRTAADTVKAGLAWLDTQEQPAFLLLHFLEPHLTYGAPEPWTRAFTPPGADLLPVPFGEDDAQWQAWASGEAPPPSAEQQAFLAGLYDGEVRAADAAVEALVAGLEARDRLDRTVLAVTSDHGEELFDHGGFEHGHSLRSPVTHVPLVLAGPGVPAGRSSVLVQHVDLFQTALTIGRVARPADTRGQDLRAIAAAQPPPPRVALSEGCIYQRSCVSVATPTHRLVAELSEDTATVSAIGADGRERDLTDAEQQPHLGPMLEGIRRMRGSLDNIAPNPSAELVERGNVTEQLKSLGYLRDD